MFSENSSSQTPRESGNRHEVLKTKLYRPSIRKEFVDRPALLERLEANALLPVTLIVAPTGYGKSILVSQWLEKSRHNYGWLSLDQEHNNLHTFLLYLVAILEDRLHADTLELERMLKSVDPSPEMIATRLINNLDQLEEYFILVLDDYHSISENKIHEILNILLKYPPQHFQLVIITRRDPPLKLARLRGQLRLHEIRTKNLAFTTDEAFGLRNLFPLEITADQLQLLVEQSEGWITGISAGLMGLNRGIPLDKVIKALHSGSSVISELLNEVVFRSLPEKYWQFMLLTSFLDRFSKDVISGMASSLGKSFFNEDDIDELFSQTKNRNLFVIPLDDDGEWYRYHHLFQSQIKNRIPTYFDDSTQSKIYKTASSWFESRNFLDEALKYALLSGDMSFAVRLFDRNRMDLHNAEEFQTLEKLIGMFPEDALHNHLELLLSKALLQDHRANFSAMNNYLNQAENLLMRMEEDEPNAAILKGQYYSLSSYIPFMQGDYHESIRQAKKGMSFFPDHKPNYFKEFALAYYSMAYQAIGRMDIGLDEISKALKKSSIDNHMKGRLLYIKLLIHSISGNAVEMNSTAVKMHSFYSPKHSPGAWMASIYGIVSSSYLSNALEDSRQFERELTENYFSGRPFGVVQHFFIHCLAFLASGEWDRAESVLEKCKNFALNIQIPKLEGLVYAFEVEMALRMKDLTRAKSAATRANFNPNPPLWYYYIPQLTEIRLLASVQEEKKAFKQLDNLIKLGEHGHNENLLIQALALKAYLCKEAGYDDKAQKSVTKAIELSSGKLHLRTFLDFGDTMNKLLKHLKEVPSHKDQISQLLDAFDQTTEISDDNNPSTKLSDDSEVHLSKRELEIAQLVALGYKNDEIADQLFVSLGTIKKHLYNTYQKLSVTNRVSAIKKMHGLGILNED